MITQEELVRRGNLWKQGEWDIPTGIDYSDFDFTWRPDPWDRPYIHEFGTQWQKTGGPRFVIPDAEGTKYQSHQRVVKLPSMDCWVVPQNIDITSFDFSWHPDATDPPLNYEFGTQWQATGGPIYASGPAVHTKYIDSPSATRTPNKRRWIILKEIDEEAFDFSWHPDSREPAYNYIFGNQVYSGELMPTVRYHMSGATQDKYSTDQIAKLSDIIEIVKYQDSAVDVIKRHPFTRAFTVFVPEEINDYDPRDTITDGMTTHIINQSIAIIPIIAKSHIKYHVEDYPQYLKHQIEIAKPRPLDIIFLSNGESVADANYARLLELTKGLPNRVARVDGVNGRVKSQHAAAETSETDWYFLVPAKLEVESDFDWSWQPDRLARRQHYIFTALNPITGLEYGHMATIAYNKTLVLKNPGRGLDFTLDDPHTSVKINSGLARYETDSWTAWRTAFREVIKLQSQGDDISKYRLRAWINANHEDTARGASDATEYWKSVNGNKQQLKLSYEWWWLRRLFCDKYSIQE